MRVALFTNNYLPFCGGVTISVETLRRGLEAGGHEAWVFAPRFPGASPDGRRVVRYPSLPAATYPEFALALPFSRRIARLVRRLEVDVLHAHHPFLLGPAAARLAGRLGRPLVFTYHTRYEKYAHYVPLSPPLVERAAVWLSTRFADRCDMVIAPSARIREELQGRGVQTPIAVVPTGVDLERFRPGDRTAARHGLGLGSAGALLLYVGRLDREKSVERVLLAFDRVASTVPDGAWCSWGRAPKALACARWPAARRRAAHHLSGSPRTRALAECYPRGDAFSSPRDRDPRLVLAEAAACGVPAVAVDARLRGGRARRRDGLLTRRAIPRRRPSASCS